MTGLPPRRPASSFISRNLQGGIRMKKLALGLAAAATLAFAGTAQAQGYPTKPITMIVGTAPTLSK